MFGMANVLAAARRLPAVLELADDHLGVGGLVHGDGRGLEADLAQGLEAAREMLRQLLAGGQRRRQARVHRVPHIGLLGVQRGQLIQAPAAHTVDELVKDSGG